ncbi:hypothetical protein EJ07DRAFT_174412 [Lizonia empirigonia]|nr:hypothetical protein EJ07DRAFT_174412 [Lizonia empirigonia]
MSLPSLLTPPSPQRRATHPVGGHDELGSLSRGPGAINLHMPRGSRRAAVTVNPEHIASQMLYRARPLDELLPATAAAAAAAAEIQTGPLRRAGRDMRRPARGVERGGGESAVDTRRHEMVLENVGAETSADRLPAYTAYPSALLRWVTADSAGSAQCEPATERRDREARQVELRELQRQWNVRRRTDPVCATERTVFRPLVSEVFDLPPPYAARDPYPLFKAVERKPSLWARVVLYPFVPEGELLNKAASATDRLAKTVVGGVKKGVEEVGKKAKAVPRQIESTRAKRKIRWLEGRGYVESPAEYACGLT